MRHPHRHPRQTDAEEGVETVKQHNLRAADDAD
jgi:hypothetical protein